MAEPSSPASDPGAIRDGVSPAAATARSISDIAEDVQRTVIESKDSALRSARSLQEFLVDAKSQYRVYEDAFVQKVKDELQIARESPGTALGVSAAAALLILRGPRRFLIRHTFGRLRNEEAQFTKAEKNVKDLIVSVDLLKMESKKLLERAALAEKDMKQGLTELMDAGSRIHRLTKSANKVESQAVDLMDDLREIPGREALKLRAEVASMASNLKQQRAAMEKRIVKISELGVAHGAYITGLLIKVKMKWISSAPPISQLWYRSSWGKWACCSLTILALPMKAGYSPRKPFPL
ncbi:hypothetical protein MLD38_007383 [Melastoma candidum]|uniref:Uncharacterized protein n=1 Tax=Melastoma candidum TaxID=119954 RepID=A0ACB9RQ70_9MYRT|nr:hypothetical protein MLD38_007383 [Melastoma candidum]